MIYLITGGTGSFGRQCARTLLEKPTTEKVIIFSRDELYIADEAFFTGTAAELTPIREVDNRTIGSGRPGSITHTLQQRFFQVVEGKDETFQKWLTYM